MKNALGLFAALAAALACGSVGAETPDGLIRIAHGFEDVYSDSRKKEAKAEKEIARIDAGIDASETLRLAGERLIADSDAEIAAHVAAYRAFGDRLGNARTADEARAEAVALADMAKSWAASEVNRARGEKMIAQSEKDAARAEARRGGAEQKLAEARDAIARTMLAAPIAAAPTPLTPEPVVEEPLAPMGEARSAVSAVASSGLEGELLGGPDN